MRILSVGNVYSTETKVERAANLVSFEIIKELSSNNEVGFLKINTSGNNEIEPALIEEYRSNNIELLEPVELYSVTENNYSLKNILTLSIFKKTFFYPLLKHQKIIEARIKKWNPDAIIVIWDEMITPVVANVKNIPIKYLYYGNLDYKVFKARSHMRFFYEKDFFIKKILIYCIRYLQSIFLKKYYIRFLSKYNILSNVALNDSLAINKFEYLSKTKYLPNMWIVPDIESVKINKKKRELKKNKIIANIGNVEATANNFGLFLLESQFLPLLRMKMNGEDFEIHILGGGEIQPHLKAKLLLSPEVFIRGFVDDIDKEIQEAKAVLTLNNASIFKVCHTRFLHVFSLGTINIAHKDAKLSMPELKDGYNAVLGNTIDDMVNKTVKSLGDKKLREKIISNGFKTLINEFDSKKISKKINNEINSLTEYC